MRLFQRSDDARRIRRQFAEYQIGDRVRLRFPRANNDPERQGDLMILKPYDGATGERGVLLISYTEALDRFAALFDVSALATRYTFVFEPSWWGYQDPTFLRFVGADVDAVVQAQWENDYDFLSQLGTNLHPLRLGAGDWVDPDLFVGGPRGRRRYDIAVVSRWSPNKRHADLFRALAEIRARSGRALQTVLIGYPGAWRRMHIESLMSKFGVTDQCTMFEGIPPEQVAELLRDSSGYVLMSRREGANKSLYESLFCDTPVVVYKYHSGVNTSDIGPNVGVLYEDGTLAQALLEVVDEHSRFEPRRWALENTGCYNATRRLNDAIKWRAQAAGRPWTRDITAKKNASNPRYVKAGEYKEYSMEYLSLKDFLLPVG